MTDLIDSKFSYVALIIAQNTCDHRVDQRQKTVRYLQASLYLFTFLKFTPYFLTIHLPQRCRWLFFLKSFVVKLM